MLEGVKIYDSLVVQRESEIRRSVTMEEEEEIQEHRQEYRDRGKLDKELVEKTLRGDNRSFTELFEAYYLIYYSLALGIMHDAGRAEDIVQDGLMTMYKELENLKDQERFGSWGYTIIRRKCLRVLRNLKSESDTLEEYTEMEALRLVQDQAQNEPIEDASNRSKSEAIVRAITELSPESYRQILMLYYIENIGLGEISKRLGLSIQTANIRLFRARKKLQRMLEGME